MKYVSSETDIKHAARTDIVIYLGYIALFPIYCSSIRIDVEP